MNLDAEMYVENDGVAVQVTLSFRTDEDIRDDTTSEVKLHIDPERARKLAEALTYNSWKVEGFMR